jgi:hypothetical protein
MSANVSIVIRMFRDFGVSSFSIPTNFNYLIFLDKKSYMRIVYVLPIGGA